MGDKRDRSILKPWEAEAFQPKGELAVWEEDLYPKSGHLRRDEGVARVLLEMGQDLTALEWACHFDLTVDHVYRLTYKVGAKLKPAKESKDAK